MKQAYPLAAAVVGVLLASATPASAALIDWTDWTSATIGNPGAAQGITSLNGVSVSYTGQVFSTTVVNGTFPSYLPASTYAGGTVSNAPSPHDLIALTGGTGTGTNTITFSTPVVNPVMTIWSLGGSPGPTATFVFPANEPFAIQAGGPSAEFGGGSITQPSSNVVSGIEGNGTIQFTGTFSTLQWTTPQFDNFSGFTVGIAGVQTPTVPEPVSLLLLGSGLAGLAAWRWMKRL